MLWRLKGAHCCLNAHHIASMPQFCHGEAASLLQGVQLWQKFVVVLLGTQIAYAATT